MALSPWALHLYLPRPSTQNLIATADFNRDGKADLIVASASANTFMVLLGNGDGTFQAPIVTAVPAPLTFLVVGDLNGDGKVDVLAMGSPSTPSIVTYLGKGDGTFVLGIASGAQATGMLADFNNDGKLDLLTTAGVQLGKGDGTFQAILPLSSGTLGAGIIGDFNGDGKLDLAGTASGKVQVLFGNGDGTFTTAPAQTLPSSLPFQLAAAVDVDGDGKADLLVESSLSLQIYNSRGDGTFIAGKVYNLENQFNNVSPAPGPVVIPGDFNKDGEIDLAANNTLLLGNGDGTFQGTEIIPNLYPLVMADLNHDGHTDIVSATVNNSEIFATIYLGDGTTNFPLAHTYDVGPAGMFGGIANPVALDLNGDGNLDLLLFISAVRGPTNGYVLLGNGDGTFQPPTTFAVPASPITGLAVADLNGDHKPDLMVVAGAFMDSQGSMYVYLNNGDGTFAAPVPYFFVGAGLG